MTSRILVAACAVTLTGLAAQSASAQEEWSFEGSELLVTNIAGVIEIHGHDGNRIIVRAKPGGSDAEMLDFQVQPDGRAEFHVVYPLDESTKYHYPRNRGGSTSFRIKNFTETSSLAREIYDVSDRARIKVGGDVDGLEAYADLEILVPRGVPVRVKLAVGKMTATDVEADLDLDIHSGSIDVENIRGDTRLDTGSGSVSAVMVRGSLDIDTGSGSVDVRDVEGDEIRVDTGSGSVKMVGVTARRVEIDTGSGSVRTESIDASNTSIDTGSGSVTLDLVRLDDGNHSIDTGSGRVTIIIPANASVRIHAETGSGGISLDIPAAKLKRMSRDEIDLEIGDGRALLEIDTGSGGVRLETRG